MPSSPVDSVTYIFLSVSSFFELDVVGIVSFGK